MKKNRVNAHRIWLVFFGFWALVLTGFFEFWFPSPGLKQWYRVNASLQESRQQIDDVEARTKAMLHTASQLQSNSVAQEREIRKVLGYLGQDEVVFEF